MVWSRGRGRGKILKRGDAGVREMGWESRGSRKGKREKEEVGSRDPRCGREGGTAIRRQRRQLGDGGVRRKLVIKARGGDGLGGRHGGGTWWCGGNGSGEGGGWSPSLIFLEQPLERENTPIFLQMTARVCGGGPFSSYRAQNGLRGERAHLRPTTQNLKYS